MGVISSKVNICNLALSKLGNTNSIENIDTGTKPLEKIFAQWYDVVRQKALKEQQPNFAMARRLVAQDVNSTPDFGYEFAYEYPQDCLRLLGIGNVEDKENTYSVEGNAILTDEDFTEDGLPIRFIEDITDVSKFTSEFVLVFATMLADKVCYQVTEDDNKKQIIKVEMKTEKAEASSLSGMENRPIRITHSKFLKARTSNFPKNNNKK